MHLNNILSISNEPSCLQFYCFHSNPLKQFHFNFLNALVLASGLLSSQITQVRSSLLQLRALALKYALELSNKLYHFHFEQNYFFSKVPKKTQIT